MSNLPFSSPDAVRAFRKKYGLTQSDFWEPVGITQSGGSRYETGNRKVPYAIQMLLALVHGTDLQAREVFDSLRARNGTQSDA